jgi:quercetin dioxygenase-like cupin family protein
VLALLAVTAGAVLGDETPAKADTTKPGGFSDTEEPVRLGAAVCYRLLDLEWKPGPLPGTRISLLAGDPATGMHHAYLELANGTKIAPHWHTADEYVTVVSGTLLFGVGDTADRNATRLFAPGAFIFVPAKTRHYAFAKGPVVISQTRSGPQDFHWVNPEDDPAKKKAPGAGATGK